MLPWNARICTTLSTQQNPNFSFPIFITQQFILMKQQQKADKLSDFNTQFFFQTLEFVIQTSNWEQSDGVCRQIRLFFFATSKLLDRFCLLNRHHSFSNFWMIFSAFTLFRWSDVGVDMRDMGVICPLLIERWKKRKQREMEREREKGVKRIKEEAYRSSPTPSPSL